MVTKKQRRELGRRAGIASALSMTREQRIARAQKANAARWHPEAPIAKKLVEKHPW